MWQRRQVTTGGGIGPCVHVVTRQGNFIVTLVSEAQERQWIVRKISLKADKKILNNSKSRENSDSYAREITQWQFVTWPDHEAAEDPMEVVRFVTAVRGQQRDDKIMQTCQTQKF